MVSQQNLSSRMNWKGLGKDALQDAKTHRFPHGHDFGGVSDG
jgi:hypothetical protein